jgi:hypothetical protein
MPPVCSLNSATANESVNSSASKFTAAASSYSVPRIDCERFFPSSERQHVLVRTAGRRNGLCPPLNGIRFILQKRGLEFMSS